MGLDSANLFLKVVTTVGAARQNMRRSGEDICRDLRRIRFDDNGVLKLIDAVLQGQDVEIPAELLEFNDSEWEIADIADRLLHESGDVSKFTQEEVQLIGWRKPRIRSEVQDALGLYGQDGFKPNLPKLRRIRDGIQDLNRAIDEVEHMLMHGKG